MNKKIQIKDLIRLCKAVIGISGMSTLNSVNSYSVQLNTNPSLNVYS